VSLALPSFSELNPASVVFLADRRPILLTRLVQCQTYGGLLVGLPNERINKSILERMPEAARAEFGNACAPVLIEPALVPFTMKQQKRRLSKAGLGPGEGEIFDVSDYRLPLVTCMASFRCPQTIGPGEEQGLFGYSVATIVWFQDRYAMPIAEEVLGEIRLLDWNRVARDVSD
jgi:hypothetical protein